MSDSQCRDGAFWIEVASVRLEEQVKDRRPLWAHCWPRIALSVLGVPLAFIGSFIQQIFIRFLLCARAIPSQPEAYCLVEAG